MLTAALGPLINEEVITDANNEIMKNIEWVAKNGPVIDAWLEEHHSGDDSGATNLAVVSTLLMLISSLLIL